MKWINCKKRLPPIGTKVIGWCAESMFFTAGAVEMRRTADSWQDFDVHERFGEQDPNVFVTHWLDLEPPRDVPSKAEMRKALKEEVCEHGVDFEEECPECAKIFADDPLWRDP